MSLGTFLAAIFTRPIPPPIPQFVCVRHWMVSITWTCEEEYAITPGADDVTKVQAILRDHLFTQIHYREHFTRDDIVDPFVLKHCKAVSVGTETRSYHPIDNVRMLNQDGRTVVLLGGGANSFLVGFARNVLDAAAFVANGDESRLFTVGGARP